MLPQKEVNSGSSDINLWPENARYTKIVLQCHARKSMKPTSKTNSINNAFGCWYNFKKPHNMWALCVNSFSKARASYEKVPKLCSIITTLNENRIAFYCSNAIVFFFLWMIVHIIKCLQLRLVARIQSLAHTTDRLRGRSLNFWRKQSMFVLANVAANLQKSITTS